mmetsp:Transcript_1141/g.2462  ORF Transcript_1141/g.2462 Transcript_1141/m.2462 type:complete len:213 (-) Transcript_1141:504-1142(-)
MGACDTHECRRSLRNEFFLGQTHGRIGYSSRHERCHSVWYGCRSDQSMATRTIFQGIILQGCLVRHQVGFPGRILELHWLCVPSHWIGNDTGFGFRLFMCHGRGSSALSRSLVRKTINGATMDGSLARLGGCGVLGIGSWFYGKLERAGFCLYGATLCVWFGIFTPRRCHAQISHRRQTIDCGTNHGCLFGMLCLHGRGRNQQRATNSSLLE